MFHPTKLRTIRKQNRLTQEQISTVLGISRSAYCGYEIGRRSPDLSTIDKLSKFYNISQADFFEDEADEISDNTPYEGSFDTKYLSQLTCDEANIVINFRIAAKDGKERIKETAKKAAMDTRR